MTNPAAASPNKAPSPSPVFAPGMRVRMTRKPSDDGRPQPDYIYGVGAVLTIVARSVGQDSPRYDGKAWDAQGNKGLNAPHPADAEMFRKGRETAQWYETPGEWEP